MSSSVVCSTFIRELIPFTFARQLHTLGRGVGDFAHSQRVQTIIGGVELVRWESVTVFLFA